jgi:NADH-quinone oxidoreductase subunit H
MTPEFTFTFWVTFLLIVVVMGVIQGTCAYLILLERKVAAWTQDRPGPNRVGPLGLFQPIADGLKFLLKEQIVPAHVDKVFYLIAPAIAVGTATLAFAVVPFGRTTPAPQLIDYRQDSPTYGKAVWAQTTDEEKALLAADEHHAQAAGEQPFPVRVREYNDTLQFVIAPHVDVGVVFVFAIGSLAVYGIVLGGWSSNSKYSFMGSLRSSAQLISYEIPMGMSVLGVFLLTGSLNLERIIDYQVHHGWNVIFQPVACLLFITAVFAECNRLPFDLPEAEQELVGGYHTEYSGMKFALFFLGEYTHMITTSFLVVILFFGGWHFPGLTDPGPGGLIVKLIVFAVKMALFILFYMLIRWTIPRFRFDQLMGLAWKVLIPLALACVVVVLVVQHCTPPGEAYWTRWLMPVITIGLLIATAAYTASLPRPATKVPLTVRGPGTPFPVVRGRMEQ